MTNGLDIQKTALDKIRKISYDISQRYHHSPDMDIFSASQLMKTEASKLEESFIHQHKINEAVDKIVNSLKNNIILLVNEHTDLDKQEKEFVKEIVLLRTKLDFLATECRDTHDLQANNSIYNAFMDVENSSKKAAELLNKEVNIEKIYDQIIKRLEKIINELKNK